MSTTKRDMEVNMEVNEVGTSNRMNKEIKNDSNEEAKFR